MKGKDGQKQRSFQVTDNNGKPDLNGSLGHCVSSNQWNNETRDLKKLCKPPFFMTLFVQSLLTEPSAIMKEKNNLIVKRGDSLLFSF